MKNKIDYKGNSLRGLSYLMKPGTTGFWLHIDQILDQIVLHKEHPFGLPALVAGPHGKVREIKFMGGWNGRDNHVTANFLAAIRCWVSCEDGRRVRGLRIITTPFQDRNPKHHFVFFEIQTDLHVLISGETVDFAEGGRGDMCELMDVLVLLSLLHDVKIQWAEARIVPTFKLYKTARNVR